MLVTDFRLDFTGSRSLSWRHDLYLRYQHRKVVTYWFRHQHRCNCSNQKQYLVYWYLHNKILQHHNIILNNTRQKNWIIQLHDWYQLFECSKEKTMKAYNSSLFFIRLFDHYYLFEVFLLKLQIHFMRNQDSF